MLDSTGELLYTPKDPPFWEERGIDPLIRDVRPYVRYYEDDVTAVQEAYDSLSNPGQKATTTRKARRMRGIMIVRHPVLPNLPPVFPELRPDEPISTEVPRRHWHGWGDPPEDERYYERLNPDSEPGIAHRNKHHGGGNTEEVHETRNPGKYHFPPTGKRNITYEHNHDELYGGPDKAWGKYIAYTPKEERRKQHVEKHHGGVDVLGDHTHTTRLPDPDENLARRLDIHPWAEALFEDATVVFFGIEGCLKADAILTSIMREGRKAAIFSVPSVTLWDAPELPEFAERKLQGKIVVVVPDGDWIKNPRVMEQARLCCTYLHRFGVKAHVAAPPIERLGEGIKGVDDFLGAGGSLDDLVVQHRIVDEWAIWDWLHKFFLAKNRRARDAEMLYDLAAHASSPDGQFFGTLARFAKVLGEVPRRVERAVHDLEELGAIHISGSLEIRKLYFSRGWGWKPRQKLPGV